MNWREIGRMAGRLTGAILSLAMLAGLYFTLIIGQPQSTKEAEVPSEQPALTASPAMTIGREDELRNLIATFPAPVMSFMSGSGMVFVSGESADAAWKGQFGRILTLYWQTAEGQPLILQSIYPADALELMGKGDYSFSSVSGPSLFGQTTVRMENGETVRIHLQSAGRGLYALTAPRELADSLGELTRSIQLFVVDQ